MEALKYMETLVKEELVAPEDKTSSGMDAYKRLTGGSASFLNRTDFFCIQKHKRGRVQCSWTDRTNPYAG